MPDATTSLPTEPGFDDIEVFSDVFAQGLPPNEVPAQGTGDHSVVFVNHSAICLKFTLKVTPARPYLTIAGKPVRLEDGYIFASAINERESKKTAVPAEAVEHHMVNGHGPAAHNMGIDISVSALPQGMTETLVRAQQMVRCRQ